MHICLISNNAYISDVKALAYVSGLRHAGHEVSVAAPGYGSVDSVTYVGLPGGKGLVGKLVRGLVGSSRVWKRANDQLAEAAIATGAAAFAALHKRVLPAARLAAERTGGVVCRSPSLPSPGARDWIGLAPNNPHLLTPVNGLGSWFTPSFRPKAYQPTEGRHRGMTIALCYRKTDSNPGKYIEEALFHAGVEVLLHTDSVNLDEIASRCDGIVFVEGPYPPIDVSGSAESTPVLFWAHHGEHHLAANVRLAARYRADAVLLAHSWHLAHHFQVPVYRFPFGAATRFFDPSKPLTQRPIDVAMVGAKLFGVAGPYQRRQQIVADLMRSLPSDRLRFAENIPSAEMSALYSSSRIVVNEGGTRHFPITMRVLESVAAGAVLLTDQLPGTDLLLEPEVHFASLSDDVAADVNRLLANIPRLQSIADAAYQHVARYHTYDHRVDQLLEIIRNTQKHDWPKSPKLSGLAALIDHDVEVQRIAQSGADELADSLPTREVYRASNLPQRSLAPGKMETVAIRTDGHTDLTPLLRAARRFIYFEGPLDTIRSFLEAETPQATVSVHDGICKVDLNADSYRINPHEMIL